MFAPGMGYWALAWIMMLLAFLGAFAAITLGARALDRQEGQEEYVRVGAREGEYGVRVRVRTIMRVRASVR